MEFRKVALILPYDENLQILFQYRKEIKKPLVKDYGFFGGGIEAGETIEQALAREIMEELEIDIKNLESLKFFKKFNVASKEMNRKAELNVFLCKMPNLNIIKCHEGKPAVMKLSDAINLNISLWDKQILTEIQKYLLEKTKFFSFI